MGLIYYVPFAATVTNAGGNNDLWIIEPADDKPATIRGIILGQTSEVADAAEEAINISIIHMAATVTNGNGTSTTPLPAKHGKTAAGFTSEVNGATVATTSGTATTKIEFAWNLRSSPYDLWFPDKDFAPDCRQGEALIVRMNTTLADDISFAGTLIVEED
jgi:hypothetical protein